MSQETETQRAIITGQLAVLAEQAKGIAARSTDLMRQLAALDTAPALPELPPADPAAPIPTEPGQ